MNSFRFTGVWLLTLGIGTAIVVGAPGALTPTWPQFRGSASRGVAENAKPPIQFGPGTNLLWKVETPEGHSSPIVAGDRIFFNASTSNTLLTCAVDRKTGATLWRGEVTVDKLEKLHAVNTATPCTPVTDGRRVFSYLPSFGVIAHDLDGREQWRKPLPAPETFHGQGSGASPLLAGDLVIVELPLERERQLIALHATDGSEAWKAAKPMGMMTWATPVSWQDANGESVGIAYGGEFLAYRLSDGKELWSVTGLGAEVCATPVVTGDRILLCTAGVQGDPSNMTMPPAFEEAAKRWDKNGDGLITRSEIPADVPLTERKADGKGDMSLKQMMGWFMKEQSDRGYNAQQWEELRGMLRMFRDGEMNRANLMLVRLGGQGDVTKTHLSWQDGRGVPEVPSPLVDSKRIYLVRNGGLFSCRDLDTGKVIFDERLDAPGGYFASPLLADGRIYLASERGVMTVVKASDRLEILARNNLAEPIFASPAAVDRTLYVRTRQHLWAFQE